MYLTQEITYTVEEVARLLSMKIAVVQRYIKAGEIEVIWRDGNKRITHDSLGNFLIHRLSQFQDKKPKVLKSRKKNRRY
jgi:predicted site-specific integrase-resolvase